MRVKDGQPKIQFQTFADMINFPVKPGEQPETSTSITEVLPLELLEGYPNHEEHFPLYTGARLSGMISSIQKHGVQTPILVWKTTDGRHIIISGHNRVNASKLAGLTTVSAVIRTDLTPKMAEDLFFEMNFQQRSLSDLRFSQRVLCVAAHYNVMKQQGRRTDLLVARVEDDDATSPDCQEKLHTDAKVAEEYELTRDTLLPHCRYDAPIWLSDTVARALDRYEAAHARLPMLEHALLIIDEHCEIDARRVYDQDNKGWKAIANAIKGRLIPDDDQYSLGVCLLSRRLPQNVCHIYLIPEQDAGDFLTLRAENYLPFSLTSGYNYGSIPK